MLFDQGGVSEGKHGRVKSKDSDGSVHVNLPYRRQITEPGKEPWVPKRAPGGITMGCSGRQNKTVSRQLAPQDYSIQETSIGERCRGKRGAAAFGPPAEWDLGPGMDLISAEKACIDNFHGLCRGDDLRALSRERHGA